MIDRRRLTHHGLTATLVCSWLFWALSLIGYDPADPPSAAAWSAEPASPRNPCGPVGAWLAHLGFQGFGWAVLLTLPALAVAAALVLQRKDVSEKALRCLGLALVLSVTAAVLGALDDGFGTPILKRVPPVGSGGYVGAFAASFLSGQFGPIGMTLILCAAGLVGGMLCHDLLVVWPIRELRRLMTGKVRRAEAPPEFTPAVYAPVQPYGLPIAEPPRLARAALERPIVTAATASGSPARTNSRNTAAAAPPRARPADGSYALPTLDMLEPPSEAPVQEQHSLIQQRALVLEKTLREHGCVIRVVQIDTGPVITMFEVELEAGLRVSRVTGLADDLAIALGVESVRVVYPLPGKSTVGVEVPNESRAMVRLSEVMALAENDINRMRIPLFLGKDVKGVPLISDLAKMPHVLIAGRTGTGKSVCLNAIILSILMTRRPDEVKLILTDPKRVELSQFRRIPHLMHPVVTDMEKAASLLEWACETMGERYAMLERARVRSIHEYNALGADELFQRLQIDDPEEQAKVEVYMHSIVIVADEMADMVMTASKEVETHIIRLAQKARAAGIHLILATQRPTVDVITGLIKSNMPARIAFQVTSRNDSRVVLDEMGAEKLLGNGDMLFLVPNTSNLVRAQGTYVSDAEINRVCAYLEQYPVEFSKELTQHHLGARGGKAGAGGMKERDELYESAVEIILREGKGSTSLLQRAMGIGYGRAARLIDYMAEDGIVGESKGSVAREVFYTWDEWEALKNGGADAA